MMTTDYTHEDDEDDEEEENYGFGIRPCGDGLFHSGYITTYLTMVYTDPHTGLNVFAVTNDDINPNIDIWWTASMYDASLQFDNAPKTSARPARRSFLRKSENIAKF